MKFTTNDLYARPDEVMEAAKQPGGVEIYNEDGTRSYHLSIPGPMKTCPYCDGLVDDETYERLSSK